MKKDRNLPTYWQPLSLQCPCSLSGVRSMECGLGQRKRTRRNGAQHSLFITITKQRDVACYVSFYLRASQPKKATAPSLHAHPLSKGSATLHFLPRLRLAQRQRTRPSILESPASASQGATTLPYPDPWRRPTQHHSSEASQRLRWTQREETNQAPPSRTMQK